MSERDYPVLLNYFGVYFASYWKELYIWEDKEPDYRDVIELSLTEQTKDKIREVIEETKRLLNKVSDDDEIGRILIAHGSNFRAPGINLTYRQWLESVLEILENGINNDNPPTDDSGN